MRLRWTLAFGPLMTLAPPLLWVSSLVGCAAPGAREDQEPTTGEVRVGGAQVGSATTQERRPGPTALERLLAADRGPTWSSRYRRPATARDIQPRRVQRLRRTIPVGASETGSLYIHNVSDLTRPIRSYVPQATMDVSPSGGLSRSDEELDEPAALVDETRLEDLIRNNIEPDSWDEPGNSIRIWNGRLIVRRRE